MPMPPTALKSVHLPARSRRAGCTAARTSIESCSGAVRVAQRCRRGRARCRRGPCCRCRHSRRHGRRGCPWDRCGALRPGIARPGMPRRLTASSWRGVSWRLSQTKLLSRGELGVDLAFIEIGQHADELPAPRSCGVAWICLGLAKSDGRRQRRRQQHAVAVDDVGAAGLDVLGDAGCARGAASPALKPATSTRRAPITTKARPNSAPVMMRRVRLVSSDCLRRPVERGRARRAPA